ncbi:hypothetical protein PAXRUDRAFT_20822 [Paxillus rubicundulus Ve08.2h10]|uniref:Uncharacterized protein n=1 Tax=Paxillus rubicundulus Ve08.2h10 TaxID=930991 RepID=A0A0D0BPL9_9AGAM|nr:hypothetical protein PAXRUDRAFT_20822 [Paxillus rubicundulus Ve08.2h10]
MPPVLQPMLSSCELTPNIWEAAHLDPPGSGHTSGQKTLQVFAQTPNTSSGFILSVAHTVPLSLTLSH